MAIILTDKLANELRPGMSNKKIAVLSARNSRLRLKTLRENFKRAEEDLGQLAHILYNGRSLGMTATRPILGIITNRKPLELSGFCFRNCQRVLVFDIFGGRALLENIDSPASSTPVQLKAMADERFHPLANIEKIGHIYNFNLYGPTLASRRPFGYLEVHPAYEKDSVDFTFFPIWKNIPREQLMDKITGEMLFLEGVLYHPSYQAYSHSFFRSWIDRRYVLL